MFNTPSDFQQQAANGYMAALMAVFAFPHKSFLRSLYHDGLLVRPKILHAECLPPDAQTQFSTPTTTGARSTLS